MTGSMDKISAIVLHSPGELCRGLGERLRRRRLALGWTQAELAERCGLSLSTLKLLESRGYGSVQRLVRAACILGMENDLSALFKHPEPMASIEALKRSERRRAPRQRAPR